MHSNNDLMDPNWKPYYPEEDRIIPEIKDLLSEIDRLKAEKEKHKNLILIVQKALRYYADDESGTDDCSVAREALEKIGEIK